MLFFCKISCKINTFNSFLGIKNEVVLDTTAKWQGRKKWNFGTFTIQIKNAPDAP